MTDGTQDAAGHPPLLDRISAAIRSKGRITFAEFMRMALYEPGLGYYMTASTEVVRSGRAGDYFTAPDLHPLFGQMVGRQVAEMVEQLHRAPSIDVRRSCSPPPDNPHRHTHTEPITIIEMGAGRGLLAEDILSVLPVGGPERLRYVVVEISPQLETEQRRRLGRFADQGIPVRWCRSLEEAAAAGDLTGIIVSNELIDAFPVHRVIMQGGRLLERFVTLNGERLIEQLDLPSTPALEEYFKRLGIRLPEGFQTEVNLEALDWMAQVGRLLNTGFVLTIDYGHAAEERYAPARREGTLACYAGHRRLDDPYQRVGRQDLTAHVDFSALVRVGRAVGLEVAGFTDQTSFLLGLGAAEAMEARLAACDGVRREVELAAMKLLLAPDGMGRIFKVLVQYKGVPRSPLSGFKFRPFVMPQTFA
ncbi:MAG: SAM-dependent methyltransferase [Nitrospirae bacterium]|nr:SAM-dependent methyltransferase [Nitrospirota bacterium]